MTAPAPPFTVRLHPTDNVVIALCPLVPGTGLEAQAVRVAASVPAGHKVATAAIAAGQPVRRYGQIIGFASRDIAPGEHVHDHNVELRDFARDLACGSLAKATTYLEPPARFEGIVRDDGRVATRNYIGILTSVNCSATVARAIADAFRRSPFSHEDPLAEFPNVDGVVALGHKTGCGMSSAGPGMEILRRTIAGYARHPNFAAVFVVGLGCEANQVGSLVRAEKLTVGDRLASFTIQDSGGTRKSVERGVAAIRERLTEANRIRRHPVSAAHLTVGLQCGGSDGLSGITANPALGAASDLVVRNGGTVILSETPESYGAEHLLLARARGKEVGDKFLGLFDWWKAYVRQHGGTLDDNPSAGNKAGGITTILEKSLGAVAKAGSTDLIDVYRYAEAVGAKGFVFMDTPGFDPVSATGQVAGGANLICFTTGRGSVFGCVPAPSLKLCTNTPVYQRMAEDMDINCGTIADGVESVSDCGQRIFERILAVASGQKTKSEALGFGEAEFAPWQLGAVM